MILEGIGSAIRELGSKVEFVVVHDRAFCQALPADVRREFHETLPHSDYMAVLASCDLALLPLEDTAFNRLKSDLKFIECCAAGVVPICSPVVYGECPEHREIGIFASGVDEWRQALVMICGNIDDIARRRGLGLSYVRERRMHSGQVAQRREFYHALMRDRVKLEMERRRRIGLPSG